MVLYLMSAATARALSPFESLSTSAVSGLKKVLWGRLLAQLDHFLLIVCILAELSRRPLAGSCRSRTAAFGRKRPVPNDRYWPIAAALLTTMPCISRSCIAHRQPHIAAFETPFKAPTAKLQHLVRQMLHVHRQQRLNDESSKKTRP